MAQRIALLLFSSTVALGCRHSPTTPPSRTYPSLGRKALKRPVARVSSRPPFLKGYIPIVMYHHIRNGKGPMFRTPVEFEKDLERFYRDGLRPVTVSQYLANRMPIGPGASPVALTFDDSNPSQLWIEKNGAVDPNCAVGIWMRFAKVHPDFPVRGTFYLLPGPFGQYEWIHTKIRLLRSLGCELGNHTYTHPILRKLSNAGVERELGRAELFLERLGVKPPVTMAYPYGEMPGSKGPIRLGFNYKGRFIRFKAALLAGSEPAPPITSRKFNRIKIPRILATSGEDGIDDWMDRVEAGKVKLYVEP
ncbi:MAG TPA: polysaccharide deacetylase family protein [Fimbriimonas sp.]|nr:polysaccharide deacetylase family protein [Fimbriimonas sp.]